MRRFLVTYREKQPYLMKLSYLGYELSVNCNHLRHQDIIIKAKSDKHAFMIFQNIMNQTKIYEVLDISQYDGYYYRGPWGHWFG